MMKRAVLIGGVVAAVGAASFCGGCERSLAAEMRAEQAVIVPREGTAIIIDRDLRPYVSVMLVGRYGEIHRVSGTTVTRTDAGWVEGDWLDTGRLSRAKGKTVMYDYIAIDVGGLIANPALSTVGGDSPYTEAELAAIRNRLVQIMLQMADINHEVYADRVFAFFKATDTGRNIVKSTFTGGTGVAALFDPIVAASLAAGALTIDNAWSEINDAILLGETVEAALNVTDEQRRIMRQSITQKLTFQNGAPKPVSRYSISDAIADCRVYAQSSSLRFMTQTLADTANRVANEAAAQITDGDIRDRADETSGAGVQTLDSYRLQISEPRPRP